MKINLCEIPIDDEMKKAALGVLESGRFIKGPEAAAFEERVSALVASDPELVDYVRSLKKREFAQ